MAKKLGMKEGSATSSLPFVPDKKIYDGLNLAKLVSVEVNHLDIKDDSNWDLMKGKSVPRLTFHFEAAKDTHSRHYYHNFNVITNEEKEEVIADGMFKSLQHMMEVYGVDAKLITRVLTDAIDVTDRSADALIATYEAFFTNVASAFNGTEDGKRPNVYKDKIVWLKLIRDLRNNGKLSLHFYPGTGFIEIYKNGQKAAIRIDVSKETIEEKAAVNPVTGAPLATGDANNIPDALR